MNMILFFIFELLITASAYILSKYYDQLRSIIRYELLTYVIFIKYRYYKSFNKLF